MLNEEQKTKETIRKIGPYILGETLGKGAFSWVKKGVIEETKTVVAMKFLLRSDMKFLRDQAQRVRVEIQSMVQVNNPHVLKLFAYNLQCKYPDKSGKTLETILLISEYCPGGELFDILYYTNKLHPTTARTYFVQLLKGLKACHDIGIVHRDIKPQNLLLDKHFQLKINDFGLSFMSNKKENMITMETYCGTRGYQAPEILKRETYTKACDIFSCGVVLFILLTGYSPFETATRDDKWYRPLCELNSKLFWKLHRRAKIDADCRDLLNGMLAYRPRHRLTLDDCLKHKWVLKREILDKTQLEAVVKKKHKQARMLRRKDNIKMENLKDSVIRKKRKICNCATRKNTQDLQGSGCRICNVFYLPVVKNFVPTLLTFFTWKRDLHKAYNAALNVFFVAFKGKSRTNVSFENPYNVKMLVNFSNGESEQQFGVALYIREIWGSGIVAFKFKRLQGDPVAFGRIWHSVEECLMKFSGGLFYDNLNKSFKTAFEIKKLE